MVTKNFKLFPVDSIALDSPANTGELRLLPGSMAQAVTSPRAQAADYLAAAVEPIPPKGRQSIRYCSLSSNKSRGMARPVPKYT